MYRFEIWDKKTKINGVEPETILLDVPENGEVYLIYINDILSILQTFDPTTPGKIPMTIENVSTLAIQTIDNLKSN